MKTPDRIHELESDLISRPGDTPDLEAVERRDRDERIVRYFERALSILLDYQSRQRGEEALRMSARAMALALGFRLAAGAESASDLARQERFSRQRVSKCVNYFLAQLSLDPLPDQRDIKARENMSRARRHQLTHQ